VGLQNAAELLDNTGRGSAKHYGGPRIDDGSKVVGEVARDDGGPNADFVAAAGQNPPKAASSARR
jgi:hypothetical protein